MSSGNSISSVFNFGSISVSIEIRLRAGRLEFSSRRGQWCFLSLRHPVQTDSGVNPVSYRMGSGGKLAGA